MLALQLVLKRINLRVLGRQAVAGYYTLTAVFKRPVHPGWLRTDDHGLYSMKVKAIKVPLWHLIGQDLVKDVSLTAD
jgi:hypothetical protein